MDANRLKVVVRGDKAVTVVDLHPVASAPRMPSGRPDHPGVGRIDGGSASGREVLAKVEVSRSPAEGTHPETEGRARVEHLERRHQEACRRPAYTGRAYHYSRRRILETAQRCMREGQSDIGIRGDGRRKGTGTNLVRGRRPGTAIHPPGVRTRDRPGRRHVNGSPGPVERPCQPDGSCGAAGKIDCTSGSRDHTGGGHGTDQVGKCPLGRFAVTGHPIIAH